MKALYQKEWFGIKFSSFCKMDPHHIATASFYDLFYDEFYKRYSSYDDLPTDWKESKRTIADFLSQHTTKQDRILSIGCGNGYVEHLLAAEGRAITAVDPSIRSSRFLARDAAVTLVNRYFPSGLDKQALPSFDVGYMSVTDYVFEDTELLDLLIKAKEYPVGRFILISIYVPPVLLRIKESLKNLLARIGLYDRGQLWGYIRSTDELVNLFAKAGFKDVESGYLTNSYIWIKGN